VAGRRKDVLDLREMLRQLRLGESARAVAKGLSVSRNTVKDYVRWFGKEGLLPGGDQGLPTAEEIAERLSRRSQLVTKPPKLLPYREEIAAFLDPKVKPRLTVKVAWERFVERHPDVRVSYTCFRRFVRGHVASGRPGAVLRLEVDPGTEAQVDFGYVGLIPPAPGEAPRKTWAFVMTLSHSRHQYVELVQDQSVATWLSLHRNSWSFFGGVVGKVLIDNLKAGIVKACTTDPEVQRAYRECAEHYGFVISPCRVRTPRHKGKVERGVRYLRQSFLPGRAFASLAKANAAALRWVLETAGVRVHGTTQEIPLEVFELRERAALKPLPDVSFELVEWKQAKLHPDCYVVFNRGYYSAPYALVDEQLWVRGTSRVVQIFHEHKLVATHVTVSKPGERRTINAHLPPHKLQFLEHDPVWCREHALAVGEKTGAFVESLLGDPALDRLRGAQATLRLAEKYGAERLEAACARAVACDAISARSLKTILARGLDKEPLPPECDTAPVLVPTKPPIYARTFDDVFQPLAV
jgi:transposase